MLPTLEALSYSDASQAKVGLGMASIQPEGWQMTLPLHDTSTLMPSCPCSCLLVKERFRRGLQLALA